MSHPNDDLIHRLYAARARRDELAVRDILAPDVSWHKPYPPPFGGEVHGVDAVFDGPFKALETLDGWGLELHDVVANNTHAVALVNWWAVRNGERMEGREAAVHHVVDGRVSDVWFLADDPRVYEFFA